MAATRRLDAILAADVAGYSRLMGVGEEGTLDGSIDSYSSRGHGVVAMPGILCSHRSAMLEWRPPASGCTPRRARPRPGRCSRNKMPPVVVVSLGDQPARIR